jgi:hypothetical protein
MKQKRNERRNCRVLDAMGRILFACDKVMDDRSNGATALSCSIQEAKRIYLVWYLCGRSWRDPSCIHRNPLFGSSAILNGSRWGWK